VIVKVGGIASVPPPNAASITPTPPPQQAKPVSRLQVEFRNGALSIKADKATLAQVLFQVHQRTGADIPIPSAAEQEQVVADIGPAPASEALASLLYGSPFDFVLVGSDRNPTQLRRVLLTPRGVSDGQINPAVSTPPDGGQQQDLQPEFPTGPPQPIEGPSQPMPEPQPMPNEIPQMPQDQQQVPSEPPQ
jgi:hypothetical protein